MPDRRTPVVAEDPATAIVPPTAATLPARSAFPQQWEPLREELTTYFRHLPELLATGNAGKYVLIKGDKVIATCAYPEATQKGKDLFGDQLFMVHRVDSRDLTRLAAFFVGDGDRA